ncbi:MAG TPA: restriction endonuclease [Chthoniobacterales bacterium]
MSRKNPSFIELLILLPWWVAAGLAAIVYFGGPLLETALPPSFHSLGPAIGLFRVLIVFIFALASLASFGRSLVTRRKLEEQTGIQSLKELNWKTFENLMGEVFRRKGYSVEEQLGAGPDGGVDLVLQRNGETTLVQCKLRTNRPVGAPTVRELFGVMAAEGATAGILVTTSTFTSEARQFAAGKALALMDGPELLRLVSEVQTFGGARAHVEFGSKPAEECQRTCPTCGSPMILRIARKGSNAGRQFWGCSSFPRCRQILNTGD